MARGGPRGPADGQGPAGTPGSPAVPSRGREGTCASRLRCPPEGPVPPDARRRTPPLLQGEPACRASSQYEAAAGKGRGPGAGGGAHSALAPVGRGGPAVRGAPGAAQARAERRTLAWRGPRGRRGLHRLAAPGSGGSKSSLRQVYCVARFWSKEGSVIYGAEINFRVADLRDGPSLCQVS